jgi:hypothetical protein
MLRLCFQSTASAPVTGRVFVTLFLNHIELPLGTPAFVRILPDLVTARPTRILDAIWEGADVAFDLPDFSLPSYQDFSNDLPGDLRLAVSFNGFDWSEGAASDDRNRLNIFDASLDPVINEIHPASGPFVGGTELSLRGANFANLPSLRCLFHVESAASASASSNNTAPGVLVESFATWVSASEARCTTPSIAVAAGVTVVQANVSASNLGTPTNSSSTSWFRFTATDSAKSVVSGSGLGLNEVDLVVAGETASFTIHAMNSEGDTRPSGGDVFYATLTATGASSTGEVHDARTFDLDERFTTVDVSRERLSVSLAETALELQADADAAALDATLAYDDYSEALMVLGLSNLSPPQRVTEWARVQQLLEHADELRYNATNSQLVAHEAHARADEAAAVVSKLMLPDADSVVEPVTLALFTYNDVRQHTALLLSSKHSTTQII